MSQPVLSDKEFIKLFNQIGPVALSKLMEISERSIYARRRRIEQRTGINVIPANPKYIEKNEHPHRLDVRVKNGVVIVGSDAHYWPGEPSLAHRAFVSFIKKMKPVAVIQNGDVMDFPRVSRHPPIGWENLPEVHEEVEFAQDRMHEIATAAGRARKIWTLGNHDCFPIDVNCLTRRGWVSYNEIRKEDQVLSLDERGNAVWSEINEILIYPFDGELVEVDNRAASMAVTKNHRILFRGAGSRDRGFEYAVYDNLPCRIYVPTGAESKHCGVSLSDDEISLAGWLLTDGSYAQGISIYQSKPNNIKEISEILDRLSISYTYMERDRNITEICGTVLKKRPMPQGQFYIKAESHKYVKSIVPNRETLPEWANDLTGAQFEVLLDAIVAGDGTWDGADESEKVCATVYKSSKFLDSLQGIAVQHGWRARVTKDNRGHNLIRLCKIKKITVEKKDFKMVPYKGDVWCLRVPHGNFMVRRNGCAFFTGNSRYETRLATVAPEYAKIHGVHLSDHFPLWEPCWSVWINDDVVVKHRFKGGIHATHNNTMWAGKTTVTGHLHSLKVTPFTDYNGTRYGVDTGCLANTDGKQFIDYTEDSPLNWLSGFVVLTFNNGVLLFPELVSVFSKDCVQFRGSIIKV